MSGQTINRNITTMAKTVETSPKQHIKAKRGKDGQNWRRLKRNIVNGLNGLHAGKHWNALLV